MDVRNLVMLGAAILTIGCGGGNTPPSGGATAPGADQTAKTATLETGANLLQAKAPIEKIAMYLDGFHVAKDDPTMQMEAHHYCNQANEDFAQCVLFDGNTADARMTGIEYIISEKLYGTLPPAEKAYWHPHNYEILSGQLRMPGLPNVAENEALKGKMNSYGKTGHTWMSGMWQRQNDQLPLGPPRLHWSFNYDGEAAAGMVEARDERMDLRTADARAGRADLAPLARPQGGVDALKGRLAGAKGTVDGVADNGDTATRAVPRLMMATANEGRPQ